MLPFFSDAFKHLRFPHSRSWAIPVGQLWPNVADVLRWCCPLTSSTFHTPSHQPLTSLINPHPPWPGACCRPPVLGLWASPLAPLAYSPHWSQNWLSCHVTHLFKKQFWLSSAHRIKCQTCWLGVWFLPFEVWAPPAPPASFPTFSAGPSPLTCPTHSQVQAFALVVFTTCSTGSPSAAWPKLQGLTKIPSLP